MAGPVSASSVLGGMPARVPSGSDQLLGSLPAGGRQPPVKLITTEGEMDSHRANPSGPGSWGPFLAWEGAGLRKLRLIPGPHVSPECLSLPFCTMGAVLLLFRVIFSANQGVRAHIGCVALGKSLKLSGPQGHICKQ